MSRIFLSHSSKDNAAAIALRDWLKAEGWDEVFLDLDPVRGVAAGERWERALHAAATRCEAVLFLISRNWLASEWCDKEYALARGLNKKLFALLIDGELTIADLPLKYTGTWQVVDLAGGQDLRVIRVPLPASHEERHVALSETGLTRLKRGLDKAGLDPKFFPWPPEGDPQRSPYRGLKPLDVADAGVLFGRDAAIVEAMDELRGLKAGASPRLLALLGASGAGKSSFLRAGLWPRLKRDDAHFLPLPPIRPERAAISGENGLVAALASALHPRTRAELRAAIEQGRLGALLAEFAEEAFRRTLADASTAKPPAIVIAIDQAEELFRPEGAAEGEALLRLIRELTLAEAPVTIALFAIRSDSYDALETAKPLQGLRQNALPLLPLPHAAYKEVIERPAARVVETGGRLEVEPQLTERMIADLDRGGPSDALPLLAFTLEQLFLEYGAAGALRLSDYEAFGGVRGAIDAAVARAFQRADADRRIPQDRAAREALLRRGLIPWLAGVDPDTRSPRRNTARRADIPAEALPLIELLVEERLLSVGVAETEGEKFVSIEPTHEALLRQWGLLEGWLAEDLALLAALEGVKRAARDWHANARSPAWLAHQGERLSEAQALDARPDIAARLDPVDRAYLAACRTKDEAQRKAEEERRREREEEQARRLRDAEALAEANRRTTRRTRVGLAVAIVLGLIAGAGGILAWGQKQRADDRTLAAVAAQNEAETEKRAADRASEEATTQRRAAEDSRQEAIARERDAISDQTAALAALSAAAVQTNPSRAVKLALAAWPRSAKDPTPKLAVAMTALGVATSQSSERKILRGHEGRVQSAEFSPDGNRIVTASWDKTARLWDAATGATIAVLTGHEDVVVSAAFSPDGTRVVTASDDRTARVWDAATGATIAVLRGHEAPLVSAAFSPDGRRVVTASFDKTARLWDAATGALSAVLIGHEAALLCAAFSPDGKRVVTASYDGTARLWEAATGARITILKGHVGVVDSAAFSPDGMRLVTASQDKTARLWDAVTGAPIAVLKGYEDTVRWAAFSPDGRRVATASDDRTARLWDAATGAPIAVLRGHEGSVVIAAFSPDGKHVVTASDDRTSRLWDAATGEPIAILRGHEGPVKSAVFSPEGNRVVTASWDETVGLWDAATGVPIAVLKGHEAQVWSAAFSPDGTRIVTASSDRTARLWDAANGAQIAVLQGHEDQVWSAAFSPDGTRVVTASFDKTARLWDAAKGAPIAVLKGHEDRVLSAAFSPNGMRVLTASRDTTARLWDAATGSQIAVLKGHEAPVDGAVFSPDGTHIVTASEDKTARLWEAATGAQIAVMKGHEGGVLGAAFSPDGTRVVTASFDKTARVWDVATCAPIAVLKGHEGGVFGAAFSPDGTRVVTASEDATARLWDAATGAPIVVLKGHEAPVAMAAFSPDGRRIITASEDKTARLWDAATGEPIAVLRGHEALVESAAFSPDGTRVVVASQENSEYDVSAIPPGDIFQIACAWLPDHDLTDIASEYGLSHLEPICEGDPPLPDWIAK